MSTHPQTEDKSVAVTDHIDEHGISDNNVDSNAIGKALAAGEAVQMRSELDDLPIHKAFRIFWRVAALCMLAAFASALEGYRMSTCASDKSPY